MAPSPFVRVRGCCLCARGEGRLDWLRLSGTYGCCVTRGGCGSPAMGVLVVWQRTAWLCTLFVSAVCGCSRGDARRTHAAAQC